MSDVSLLNEVKTSVANLPPSDLEEFRRWFDEFDAEQWDLRFEQNIADGKLDALAREALERFRKGECDEL